MSKELRYMRFGLKMDSEIDKYQYLSPGGYELKSKNKSIQFDFERYLGYISNADNTVVDFECVNPDVNVFPQMKEITEDFLNSVDEIVEFYIDLEDENIKASPKEILYWKFEFDDGTIVDIKDEILHKFKF